MAQNHVLSNVSCCVGRSENLTCSSEMRMQKLVLGLSLAQMLPEKMKKTFLPEKLGSIDVLRTVCGGPCKLHRI